MNCRAYANVYKRRGKLIPQPCEVCGATKQIQMHHDDYSKPLEVRWLCKDHHEIETLIDRTWSGIQPQRDALRKRYAAIPKLGRRRIA